MFEEIAARDELIRPRPCGEDCRLGVDPAVDHNVESRHAFPHRGDLRQALRDELLSAITRMDRHHEQFVARLQVGEDEFNRSLGIEHETRANPHRADPCELVVDVAVRLHVDLNRLRARLRERFEIQVGTRHHQMDIAVEIRLDAARKRHDVGTEREVRYEVGIHHVDVQRLRAGLRHPRDFRAENAEVGREKRGKDLDLHGDLL